MNVAGQTRVSVCLVENCGDGSGDDGPLQPAFQLLRILLGKNTLAGSIGHRKAANLQDGHHVARPRLGTRLSESFRESLRESLRESFRKSLRKSLRIVLPREIALVFVALYHERCRPNESFSLSRRELRRWKRRRRPSSASVPAAPGPSEKECARGQHRAPQGREPLGRSARCAPPPRYAPRCAP